MPEDKDLKRGVWQKIDDMMESSDVVMASSTSGIVPSLLSDHLRHRHRFLVAHPVRMLVSAGLHAIIQDEAPPCNIHILRAHHTQILYFVNLVFCDCSYLNSVFLN